MRHINITLLLAACLMAGCQPDGRDMEQPAIIDYGNNTCPADCEQFHTGDTIHFCYQFMDNEELGNYNIEIHNNFDHHTHSTSSVECDQEADKVPVNPWIFNHDYSIPEGSRNYTAQLDIAIPDDADPGDYHFMVRLTDRAGWQQLRSVAIKLLP